MSTTANLSIAKAVRILELIAKSGPMSGSAVAKALSMSRSTAHRLLLTLERERLLATGPDSRIYHLGIKLFQLGHAALGEMDLREQARPVLEQLCQSTSETVHLSVCVDAAAVYIDKIEPNQMIRMYSRLGLSAPMHCTGVGKVLMAAWPKDKIDAYVARGLTRFTANTITDGTKLLQELARVAAQGWAHDNEEHENGIRCMAAPIRDHRGVAIAAVSVAALGMRTDAGRLQTICGLVRSAAEAISLRMGCV